VGHYSLSNILLANVLWMTFVIVRAWRSPLLRFISISNDHIGSDGCPLLVDRLFCWRRYQQFLDSRL